ncbi:hypothetical protein KKH27_14095 [bacterium]|nr:hypothetical protein [bacterium]MBU1984557.1 hypothetical protein [bacterium]
MIRGLVLYFALLVLGFITGIGSVHQAIAAEQPENWNGVPFGGKRGVAAAIIDSLFAVQFKEENSIMAVAIQQEDTLLVRFIFDPVRHELTEVSYGGNAWLGDPRLGEYAENPLEISFASVERRFTEEYGKPTVSQTYLIPNPLRKWQWDSRDDYTLTISLTAIGGNARVKYNWRPLISKPVTVLPTVPQNNQTDNDTITSISDEIYYASLLTHHNANSTVYAIGGLCMLAAGTVSFFSANAWSNEAKNTDDIIEQNPDLRSVFEKQRDRYKRYSGQLIAVGAFCCLAGIVLELFALDESYEANKFLRLSAISSLEQAKLQLAMNF